MVTGIEQGIYKKMLKLLDKMDVVLNRMEKSVDILDEMADEEEGAAQPKPQLRLVK